MTATPPLSEDLHAESMRAARRFLDEIEVIAAKADPTYAKAEVSAQRGMLMAMAVQALGLKEAHPPGAEFRALIRGIGMGFGALIAGSGPIGQATAAELFNGGLDYALAHTLHSVQPTGGVN